MIRLVQRRLIIPRGDTGEFSVPLLPHFSSENIAVFTIIDQRTKKFIFTKRVTPSGETLTISFDHNETVNLPEGKYVWDIKLYQNPVFADDELVNGDEIDSYYAAYSLPDCEIRLTGDKLLVADNSPSHTLDVESLNTINAAINETQHAAIEAQGAADSASESASSAASDASAAADSAATAQDIADHMVKITKVSQLENDAGYISEETDPTVPSWAKQENKPQYTAQEVGALPNNTTYVSTFNGASGVVTFFETDPTVPAWAKTQNKPSYTATEVGALPDDTYIPTKTSDLTNDSNFVVDANYVHTDNNYTTEEKNQLSGKADKVINATNGNFSALDINGNLIDSGHKHSDYLVSSLKGANNGLAELDAEGKIPSTQLPSYVDDVLEYDTKNSFPATGEAGKIYVAKDTNLTYRWSGSTYIEISQSLALGETSSTAYRGDYGATAYTHAVTNKGSAFTSGLYKITTNSEGHITNASNVEKSDITALGIPGELSVTDVQIDGTSILNNTVANIPLAASNTLGVVKTNSAYGVKTNSQGLISTSVAIENEIQTGTDTYKPIVPSTVAAAAFYGLAKAAGDITQASTDTFVGDYTDSAKAAILHMLGIDTFVAPRETALNAQRNYAIGDLFMLQGKLYHATTTIAIGDTFIERTNCDQVKISEAFAHDVQVNGTSVVSNGVANIVPAQLNGTYGVIKLVSGNGLGVSDGGNLIISGASSAAIKNGTNEYTPIGPIRQHESVFYGLARASGDTTQSASSNAVGTYTPEAKSAIQFMLGVSDLLAPRETSYIASQAYDIGDFFTINGKLYKVITAIAESGAIVVQDNGETVSGANAIQCKLGNETIKDVQVNGTSILSNGVANVPVASGGNLGLVKTAGTGIFVNSTGEMSTVKATSAQIKAGTANFTPIVPSNQHESAFYALAKAAGDTTQSASSNTVGTYTSNAKASIKSMLGIVDGSTITVEVTGTTPTITAVESARYVCGEVSTLSITPPASGICIVRFTSGTTATVLTLPSTVKFPEWFDATTLEANTIYEICITDGVYGAVMSWAL